MFKESLKTDALVLIKDPPKESFETLAVFSAEHGTLRVHHRVPRKSSPSHVAVDLFDELSLWLEAGNGGTWFTKEVRVLLRHSGIGRRYDALRAASALTALIARNPVQEESRAAVHRLLRTAFTSLEQTQRPDIVYFKSVYCFARDEGHPLKQQWFPTLPAADRADLTMLLNQPVAQLTTPAERVEHLRRRLEDYLRGHTEIVVGE
jgi:hypothetical protein